MTARQCFDHPWLKDLQNTMSINVPSSDHSEELALDMVVPSNWHMSPDRRSSLSTSDSLYAERSSLKIDGQSISLSDLIPSRRDSVRENLSEDKDSISKTLSHIDIDRHSIDRSSTASFETCPESIDGGQGSDTPSLDSGSAFDISSSSTLVPLASMSGSETLSVFATEVVELVARAVPLQSLSSDSTSEDHTVVGVSTAENSQDGTADFIPAAEVHVLPNSSSPITSNASEVPQSRDSNRLENSKKRMSMEIPHKKAKCVEQGEEERNDEVESEKLLTAPQSQ